MIPRGDVTHPTVGGRRKNKELDLIAQADLAERRAIEEQDARTRAGYPLAALAAERQAVADLRAALTTAVCAVLELCRPKQAPGTRGTRADGGSTGDDGSQSLGIPGGRTWRDRRAEITRGPPSTLVQMVCSGQDASVRCATSVYRLSTGVAVRSSTAAAGSRTGEQRNRVAGGHRQASSPQSQPLLQPAAASSETELRPSRFREAATTVAEAGRMARTLLRGFLDTGPSGGNARETSNRRSHPSRSPSAAPPPSRPPTNPWEALLAARAAAADVRSFSAEVCKVAVGARDDGAKARNVSGMPWAFGVAGSGGGSVEDGSGGANLDRKMAKAGLEMDTTATTRVVNALRADALWAESLPAFVSRTLETHAGDLGQQMLLR